MATTAIQAINATISFKKTSYVIYGCPDTITLEFDTANESVFTIGDGVWNKVRPISNSWTITLGGVHVFDTSKFTGWDILANQLGWVDVDFLLTYDDANGNVKSFQGFATIEKSTLTSAVGNVVKDEFILTGNGELKYFDGLIPCPTTISTITPSGLTDPSGNITIGWTGTGAISQVKYRLDGVGIYQFADNSGSFPINGVPIGDHSIEIIPICANNYEGTGLTQTFSVTGALTCSLTIDSLTHSVTGNNVTWTIHFNADPSTASIKYQIDGGSWIFPGVALVNPYHLLTVLPVGTHTINVVPICSNGVSGTGATDTATVSSGSVYSQVDWSFTAIPGGPPAFQIYVNGILTVSVTATNSGTISVANGATVKALVQTVTGPRDMSLTVTDVTTSTTLYNHSQLTSFATDQYTWTANGDHFSVSAVVSP